MASRTDNNVLGHTLKYIKEAHPQTLAQHLGMAHYNSIVHRTLLGIKKSKAYYVFILLVYSNYTYKDKYDVN